MSSIKEIIFFTPILFVRKIVLSLLILVVILGVLLYILGNSSLVIKKVANCFASDYNISYSRIDGNIFTGLKVDNLSYTNHSLAKKVIFRWNPVALLHKELCISKIDIENLDVDNVKILVSSFALSKDDNSTLDSNESSNFPISISVKDIDISLNKFVQNEIEISDVKLSANRVLFNNNKLDIKSLKLFIDTNLTDLNVDGVVESNSLNGKLIITPKEALFKVYNLPLSHKAIESLTIDFNASQELIVADIDTSIIQALKDKNSSTNIDIKSLKSHAVYRVDDGSLVAKTNLLVNSNYAKDVAISNEFRLKDTQMRYSGEIKTNNILGVDKKLLELLKNLNIAYRGDNKSIKADLATSKLKGSFISDDLKNGKFHLASKSIVLLSKFINLPPKLAKAKADFVVDAPISFEANATQKATAKITSNIVNIDANVTYKKKLFVETKITIPKKSLLKEFDKNLNLKELNPINIKSTLNKNRLTTTLKSPVLKLDLKYLLDTTKVDGLLNLKGYKVRLLGETKNRLDIKLNIDSIQSFAKKISKVYNIGKVPNIFGIVTLNLSVDKLKDVTFVLKSPKIINAIDKKHKQIIKDLAIEVAMSDSEIVLKSYKLIYNKEKIFSTKPSKITIDGDNITIKEFWLNDNLKVTGNYNLKTKKGNISTSSKKLHISHELIDLDTNIDLKILLDDIKTSIDGSVNLLGGDIHYDVSKKTFASDSDIIIVQKMKKKEQSLFMKNLSLNVNIKTKKPLRYKKDNANIQANVDLGIHKSVDSEILALGKVSLLKGGSYIFEGKRFILDKSSIYFTGNPNKPLLDIVVKYKSVNYLVTIHITGGADMPIISFSSKPTLTKEQILSLILFDTEEAAGTNSGEDMMRMMGGAMAKSALNNVGISLDHLVIGEDNSVEVGKKLTNKITIIYINGKVAKVKLKYQHSKHTESIIGVSEVSQSYDIVYKRDF